MDASNDLINAGLFAALVPILVAVGQMLKMFPLFAAAPQWVAVVNLGLGAVLAVAYTWARGDSAHVPATSVEYVIAAITGAVAALAASKLYDALVTTQAKMAARGGRPPRRRSTDVGHPKDTP